MPSLSRAESIGTTSNSELIDQLAEKLIQRDVIEQAKLSEFRAFQVASTRAINAEKPSISKDTEEGGAPSGQNEGDIIELLKESRKNLEKQLVTLQSQLDKAQERARDMSEEQYLKTHVVHGLHDEVLALTMQLNLSEEKRKRLQDELGR